jgi:hypothetical protein
MKAPLALACTLALVASTGGCAWWDAHGWKHMHAERAAPTDTARARCEAATETLKGKPDHDSALAACLDEQARRGK